MAVRKTGGTSADMRLKKMILLVPDDRKLMAEKLAGEIAFMSRTLEVLKASIDEMGPVEGAGALKSYNTTVQRYGAICKQFTDLLPKAAQANAGSALYDFIKQA